MEKEVFETVCPHCNHKNKVLVLKREGFNQKEEFYCAHCGFQIGTVMAAERPRTEVVPD